MSKTKAVNSETTFHADPKVQSRIEKVFPQRRVKESRGEVKLPLPIRMLQNMFKIGGKIFPGWTARYGFKLFTQPRKRAKHFRDDKLLLQSRVSYFEYQRDKLTRYDWGESDKHIMLVHGWESRATALRHFVEPLLDLGYQVTAFDAPAHGESEGEDLNMVKYAHILAEFWPQFDQIHAVIAHSFGGSACVYALSHLMPDFPMPKLVTIGSPASAEGMLDGFLDFAKAPKPMRKAFYRYVQKMAGHSLDKLDYRWSVEKNSIQELLLVHDTADDFIEFSEALLILEHWKEARLLATQGYGHYALMKHPAVVNKIVKFIHE